MDTNKKISFGFNKLAKKSAVIRAQPAEEKKVELVECLEGQSIKIKDAVEIIEEPLVIPIQDNKKNLLDRVKEAKAKRVLIKEEDNRPDSELSIEELAARALINDAKNRLENNTVSTTKVSVLPAKEDKFVLEGEEEPTLEDYENIPISDYGLAMLRGMGWKEGIGIGKNPTKTAAVSAPELRPKGLGLGATRIVKTEEPARDKEGNTLILKRGAFAKIIAGLHKGNYCEVQGLDDEAGRVIVKTSLKGDVLTLNEFLLVPVTKDEFSRCAKVLNNAKYEKYKEISDRKLEAYQKTESKVSDNNSDKEPEKESNSKNKYSGSLKAEPNSDNDVNNISSEDESMQKPKERNTYKNRSYKDEKGKYKRDGESHGSRSGDKKTRSPDSDDKHERSRNKYRDSSDSDDGRSRRKKSKDKRNKKDKHRDRSKSRKEKQSKYKSSESRDRSPSYDYKEGSSKKHKSKKSHRRRSSSNSSKEDHRKNRR